MDDTDCLFSYRYIFNIQPLGDPPEKLASNIFGEIWAFLGNFLRTSYIYTEYALNARALEDRYNGHVWAVAVFFRSSVIVYIVLLCMLGFHKYPASARLWILSGVMIYFMFLVDGYVLLPPYDPQECLRFR